MKLLLEKNIVLSNENLNFKLMLDDEWSPGRKKDENEQDYILYIPIVKGMKIESIDMVKKIQEVLADYFLNSNEHRKALYIPKTHEVSLYGEGYIDVFYELKYKHHILDNGYETDDNEIGKNLMSVHIDNLTDITNVIKIQFKSLFIVDELYNMQTLWDIGNGQVYEFLLDEVSNKLNELEE